MMGRNLAHRRDPRLRRLGNAVQKPFEHPDAMGASGNPVVNGQHHKAPVSVEHVPFINPALEDWTCCGRGPRIRTAAHELEIDRVVDGPLNRNFDDVSNCIGMVEP